MKLCYLVCVLNVFSSKANERRSECHPKQLTSRSVTPDLQPLPSHLLRTNLQPLISTLSKVLKQRELGSVDCLRTDLQGFLDQNNTLGKMLRE
jgi:hypothetical protein